MDKFYDKKYRHIIILLLSSAIIAVAILFFLKTAEGDKIVQSILNAFRRGDSYRLTIWKDSIRMFILNPLTGVGLGNYSLVYPLYETVDFPWLNLYAYNELLHILTETGIIGFSGFALFFYIIFKHVWHQFASLSSSEEMPMLLPLLYGCVSTLVQGMVSYDLHSSTSSYLFFISLGILAAQRSTACEKQLPNKKRLSTRIVIPCLAAFLLIWGVISEYERIKGHYFYSQGILSFKSNNTVKGMYCSLKALQYQPYKPEYHYLVGVKYGEIGDVQSSINHYRKAHKLSPYIYNTISTGYYLNIQGSGQKPEKSSEPLYANDDFI